MLDIQEMNAAGEATRPARRWTIRASHDLETVDGLPPGVYDTYLWGKLSISAGPLCVPGAGSSVVPQYTVEGGLLVWSARARSSGCNAMLTVTGVCNAEPVAARRGRAGACARRSGAR